ncbi:unnamed protein product [Amaranthus hypochondriacus]
MSNTKTQQQQHQQQENLDNVPPAGYPTLAPPEGKMKKKSWFGTKSRGKKGFLEGCLAGLCCCWICEACCC